MVNTQQYGTPVPPVHRISGHAKNQMDARSLSADALRSTVKYGRTSWTRGARIYAIGRKETHQRCRRRRTSSTLSGPIQCWMTVGAQSCCG